MEISTAESHVTMSWAVGADTCLKTTTAGEKRILFGAVVAGGRTGWTVVCRDHKPHADYKPYADHEPMRTISPMQTISLMQTISPNSLYLWSSPTGIPTVGDSCRRGLIHFVEMGPNSLSNGKAFAIITN